MYFVRFVLAGVTAVLGVLLVVPVVVLAVPFMIVSFLTTVVGRVLEPRYLNWGDLIEFDPSLGWKPRAADKSYHLADDIYAVTTDEEGWRGKRKIEESDIVVFGDSFAWGFGIDDDHVFAESVHDIRIKTIGTVGYNMVQELLWMRRLAPELRGKLVVWFIYFGNDLYENLVPDMCGYRMPFVRPVNGTGVWEVVTSHINPQRWPNCSEDPELRRKERNYYGKLADLCSKSFLSDRAYPAGEYLLREGADLCRQSDAKLVVMTIPDATQMTETGKKYLLRRGGDPRSFDADYPDREIGNICEALGIELVRLKNHLDPSDYKIGDCHWNARGHRKVAEVLLRVFLRSGQEFQVQAAQSSSKAIRNGSEALV